MEKLILYILFVTHWALVLASITYFLWGDKSMDKLYLIFWTLLASQWIYFDDCLISKYERQILNIKGQEFVHPSMQFYSSSNLFSIYIFLFINMMYLFNLYIVMRRTVKRKLIYIPILLALTIYFIYFRYKEVHLYMHK